MGNLRVFLKSVRFAFRNKHRSILFIMLFTSLSVFVVFYANTFTNYSKADLLINKGVIIKQSGFDVVDYNNATVQTYIDTLKAYPETEAVIVHRYINYGNNIRIFDVNYTNPWAYSLVTPRSIMSGRFISSQGEALVVSGKELNLDSTATSNATIDPSPGDKITISIGQVKASFYVVGEISPEIYIDTQGKAWVFVDTKTFDTIVNEMSTTVYVYEVTVLAKGNLLFSNEPYQNKKTILDKSRDDILNAGLAPNYFQLPDGIEPNIDRRIDERNTDLFIFLGGTVIALFIMFIYGLLIIKYRKTEIAVLKTVGYDSWNIRAALLAEVISLSVVGYILGILGLQAYLLKNATSLVNSILSWDVILLSFFIVVLFDIPSVFISSHSLVKIKPLDVFRDRG